MKLKRGRARGGRRHEMRKSSEVRLRARVGLASAGRAARAGLVARGFSSSP